MKNKTLAILTGALAFSGAAAASNVFTEDFESGSSQWDIGAVWGSYGTGSNFSGSSHGQIPGGGANYGNLITGKGSSITGGPATATLDFLGSLTAGETTAVASGNAGWNFEAWLASYTAQSEVALISIEWFDGSLATGNSLGSQTLADGLFATNVTESIDGSDPPAPGTAWTTKNWSHYVTNGTVPVGAVSFIITYVGQNGGNGNDAYADLFSLDIIEIPAVDWSGALSSEWSNNPLGLPQNWVETGTATPADFANGNKALFNDSATTTTPDISIADVSPVETTFDNTAKDFTLSGTNAIATGELNKDGTGRLTINNVNTFTGATNLNAGTIELGNSLALATSPLSITSGADLNFGTLTAATLGGLNGDGDIVLENMTPVPVTLDLAGGGTHTGILSGGGSLTKSGGGTQALGGANTFAGAVTIDGGAIRMQHATALGTDPITINDGGSLHFSFGDGTTTTVANDISLPPTGAVQGLLMFGIFGDNGAASTLGTFVELSGVISGGTAGQEYRLTGSNPTHLNSLKLSNAANSFEGNIVMWRSDLIFTSDEALGNLDNDIVHVTENTASALTFDAPGITLNSQRTIDFSNFNNPRPINTQANDGTIAGPITGTGTVTMIKQGSGKLTLTGATTFIGTARVDEGTLALAGSADLGTVTDIGTAAAGTFDVTAIAPFTTSANLFGEGTIAGETVANGNVAPGTADDDIGTLTTGDFTVDFTYDAELDSSFLVNDLLVVNGDLTITGGAELLISDIDPAVRPDGTEYVIAEYTGTLTGVFDFFDGGGFVTLNDGDGLTSGGVNYVIDYDDTTPGPNKYITLTIGLPVGGSAFDTWATGAGLDGSPGKEAGFLDDGETDNLSNGLEWILGGNPLLHDASSVLPTLEGSTGSGLTLTFTREEDSIGEATLLVQWNTDIDSAWNDVTVGATSSGPDANGVVVTVNDATDPDTVTVNIPASNAPTGKIFARLNSTMP